MRIDATVMIEDIMDALELGVAPEGFSRSDTVEIRVDIDEDDARAAVPEPEPILPSELFDQTEVMDLAAAIHRGDRTEAELLLDRILSEDTTATEWVQLGRFSKKGRPSIEPLRKAA